MAQKMSMESMAELHKRPLSSIEEMLKRLGYAAR
jgi:hypothetical protein